MESLRRTYIALKYVALIFVPRFSSPELCLTLERIKGSEIQKRRRGKVIATKTCNSKSLKKLQGTIGRNEGRTEGTKEGRKEGTRKHTKWKLGRNSGVTRKQPRGQQNKTTEKKKRVEKNTTARQ